MVGARALFLCTSGPTSRLTISPEACNECQLRAALDYLGDNLATHHASRYKPAKHRVLDRWLAARRLGYQATRGAEQRGYRIVKLARR